MDTKLATRIARVAIQLNREDAGAYHTVSKIAGDATDLVLAADAYRAAHSHGAKREHLQKIKTIAETHAAGVDTRGATVGLKLTSGRYALGVTFPLE